MNEYKELAKVATRYYDDRNFCSVIAVAIATGRKFGKCRAAFKRQNRRHRCGTYKHQQRAVLKELGFKSTWDIALTQETHGRWLQNVTRHLPSVGTFWVYTAGHVTCVKDGVIEDWSGDGSRKRVKSIYRVEAFPSA